MTDRRLRLLVALTALAVGATGVVLLLALGHPTGALYAMVATNVVITLAPLLERRSGRAASPPARTEITRTTGGRADGRVREHEDQ